MEGPMSLVTCPQCDGNGTWTYTTPPMGDGTTHYEPAEVTETCTLCNGEGRVEEHKARKWKPHVDDSETSVALAVIFLVLLVGGIIYMLSHRPRDGRGPGPPLNNPPGAPRF